MKAGLTINNLYLISEDKYSLEKNTPIQISSDYRYCYYTMVKYFHLTWDSSYVMRAGFLESLLLKENHLQQKFQKAKFIRNRIFYLNAPYLWGGKTPFGIDCSGFTQMVYKLNGHKLLRDASQQATQGEPLSFIEESEPGDLAFFDNAEGNIIHVGIIMEDHYIIHATGKVRIDRLDHSGIFNYDLNEHTHKLRVIKRIV